MSARPTILTATVAALTLGVGAPALAQNGDAEITYRGQTYQKVQDHPALRVSGPKIYCSEDGALGASFLLNNDSGSRLKVDGGPGNGVADLGAGEQTQLPIDLEHVAEPDLGGGWSGKLELAVDGDPIGVVFAATDEGTRCEDVVGYDSAWIDGTDGAPRVPLYVMAESAPASASPTPAPATTAPATAAPAPLGPRVQTGTAAPQVLPTAWSVLGRVAV